MKQHRFTDPQNIDPANIAELIEGGSRVIVQYSKSGYCAQQLALLNQLAKTHGRSFEIRFYGHYSEIFDASVLQFIPDAKCVSIDCLLRASNVEALSKIHDLVELNIGVFELEDSEILQHCNYSSLKSLTLGDTKKCNINISHISKCINLERFHTTGHTKNISTICSLPLLQSLSLSSIKKKDSIDFVSKIPGLKELRLILGGRISISDITSAQLKSLEIIRVQGLEEIGNLGRFENLESLLIEDQIKVATIVVGPNPCLKDIKIINCKTLERIAGVTELNALSSLRISRTAIDYEKFIAESKPKSMKTLAFYTGKNKQDLEIRKDLERRGFLEFSRK